MTISDLLTLIGIIIAILTFVSEKNREYIFLKLSSWNLLFLIASFVYIHFLLSYDWWKNIIDFPVVFQIDELPSPEIWAYIISVSVIFWATHKIFRGKFPLSNKTKLLNYYNKLILRNEVAFLAQLIENYHLSQIIDYLQTKKSIVYEKKTGIPLYDDPIYKKEAEIATNTKNRKYGASVYRKIILNDTFLENLVNINPYLFVDIIEELNVEELKNDEFINKYLKILTLNKNGFFFREIRNNQNLTTNDAYRIEKERPILYAFFNDIKVCSINEAWRGIGEQAIYEIEEEAKKSYSQLRESDREQENDTIWSYRITIAISYFDIMVRQAIVQKIDNHMWMFYYFHFVHVILSNMEDLPSENSTQNRESRNFNLIEMIFDKMIDWKKVNILSKNDNMYKSIYDCIGQCIYEVSKSNKLCREDKLYLIRMVWYDLLLSYSKDPIETNIIDKIIDVGFKTFKKPSMGFSSTLEYKSEDSMKYLVLIDLVWKSQDLVKLVGCEDRVEKFRVEVFEPLFNTPK
jgi:hypothetical protein